ncbi:transposable element Tcb2 transposase [Trichonephila clavipes]|uniref:Transposable element Tcb2 transposase n=1 Tax=Trichonephila clavipes TaxID=2585209 RepID=A0A8X6VPB0_TRICX|nr:transposable element Tcb2 transposase [Trichonephila clavipes]
MEQAVKRAVRKIASNYEERPLAGLKLASLKRIRLDGYKRPESGLLAVELIPNKWYYYQEDRPRLPQSPNIYTVSRERLVEKHQSFIPQEKGRALLSDELKFCRHIDFRSSGEKIGARFHPSYITEIDRFRGRALVRGSIILDSRTPLYVFDDSTVISKLYMDEILDVYIKFIRGGDIWHMNWPLRSPDLNPIEHIWDALGKAISQRGLPPRTS